MYKSHRFLRKRILRYSCPSSRKKKKRYSHSSVAHPVNGNVSWVSLHFLLKMLRALFCDIVASLLPVNPRTIAKCFQK